MERVDGDNAAFEGVDEMLEWPAKLAINGQEHAHAVARFLVRQHGMSHQRGGTLPLCRYTLVELLRIGLFVEYVPPATTVCLPAHH